MVLANSNLTSIPMSTYLEVHVRKDMFEEKSPMKFELLRHIISHRLIREFVVMSSNEKPRSLMEEADIILRTRHISGQRTDRLEEGRGRRIILHGMVRAAMTAGLAAGFVGVVVHLVEDDAVDLIAEVPLELVGVMGFGRVVDELPAIRIVLLHLLAVGRLWDLGRTDPDRERSGEGIIFGAIKVK